MNIYEQFDRLLNFDDSKINNTVSENKRTLQLKEARFVIKPYNGKYATYMETKEGLMPIMEYDRKKVFSSVDAAETYLAINEQKYVMKVPNPNPPSSDMDFGGGDDFGLEGDDDLGLDDSEDEDFDLDGGDGEFDLGGEEDGGGDGLQSDAGRLANQVKNYDGANYDSDMKYLFNSLFAALDVSQLEPETLDNIQTKFDGVKDGAQGGEEGGMDLGDETEEQGGDGSLGLEMPDSGEQTNMEEVYRKIQNSIYNYLA